MKSSKAKNILHYVVLVIVCFISLFPLLYAFSASLRSDVELYKYALPFSIKTIIPVEPTLDNYKWIFTEFGFGKSIVNTLIIVFILVPLGLLVNSVAAFAFTAFDFKGKNILFAVFVVSFMVPFEAIAIPLYSLVNKIGWVDKRVAMILPSVANGLVLFLFRQFFSEIPKSYFEAATMDGANWLQIYFRIIIPLSAPVMITAALMLFVSFWNSYLWPLLVARSKDIRTVQITLATLKMEEATLWGCLYAGSIVSALIPLTLFLPFQKYFVDGITSSGVKE